MYYCVTVFPEKSNFSDENVAEEMEDKLENDKRGIFHYGSGQLKKWSIRASYYGRCTIAGIWRALLCGMYQPKKQLRSFHSSSRDAEGRRVCKRANVGRINQTITHTRRIYTGKLQRLQSLHHGNQAYSYLHRLTTRQGTTPTECLRHG